MKNDENVQIRQENVRAIQKYLNAAKELNRFVKDCFTPDERMQLVIAPIINDLHVQIDELEKEVNTFLKSNPSDFVHKGDFFKGKLEWYSNDVYYINVTTNVDKNKCTAEIIKITGTDDKSYKSVYCVYEKRRINAIDIMQRLLSEDIVPIESDEYYTMRACCMDIVMRYQNIAKQIG